MTCQPDVTPPTIAAAVIYSIVVENDTSLRSKEKFRVGMWKRSILVPLPPLPLPLPLPFCSSNTSSYPTHQNGSGQSLPHPY